MFWGDLNLLIGSDVLSIKLSIWCGSAKNQAPCVVLKFETLSLETFIAYIDAQMIWLKTAPTLMSL